MEQNKEGVHERKGKRRESRIQRQETEAKTHRRTALTSNFTEQSSISAERRSQQKAGGGAGGQIIYLFRADPYNKTSSHNPHATAHSVILSRERGAVSRLVQVEDFLHLRSLIVHFHRRLSIQFHRTVSRVFINQFERFIEAPFDMSMQFFFQFAKHHVSNSSSVSSCPCEFRFAASIIWSASSTLCTGVCFDRS